MTGEILILYQFVRKKARATQTQKIPSHGLDPDKTNKNDARARHGLCEEDGILSPVQVRKSSWKDK